MGATGWSGGVGCGVQSGVGMRFRSNIVNGNTCTVILQHHKVTQFHNYCPLCTVPSFLYQWEPAIHSIFHLLISSFNHPTNNFFLYPEDSSRRCLFIILQQCGKYHNELQSTLRLIPLTKRPRRRT